MQRTLRQSRRCVAFLMPRTTASAEAFAKENPSAIRAPQSMPNAKSTGGGLSSLRRREHDIKLHKMSGISRFRWRLFHGAICIAAFGFVAFVLLFVHPAAQSRRAAAQQADVGSDVAAAGAAGTGVHLAAPKRRHDVIVDIH